MRSLPRATALSLLLIAAFTVGSVVSSERVHANPGSFTLFGRSGTPAGWGFTSSTVTTPGPDITVQPGEAVDAIINSGDGGLHNWWVDYNGDGAISPGEPFSSNTQTSTSFTFAATTTPGVYTYWCSFHRGSMHGSFIVGPYFLTTTSPSSLTIDQGSSQTSTLTISSLNGFSGTVNFTTPTTPAGITAVLSTNNVTVTPSTPGTIDLNVTVGSSMTPGSYSVSTTGSGGGNTRLTSVAVVVVGPSSLPSPAAGFPTSVLIIIGAVIAASVLVVAVVVLKRKPRK